MVSIHRCKDYEEISLTKTIDQIFKENKFDDIIKPNMNVVIKPNLFAKCKTYEALTTHPLMIAVIAKKLLSLGAKVIICDAQFINKNRLRQKMIYRYNELDILNNLDIKLSYTDESVPININGKILSKIDILKTVMNADLIINLPKLKTHNKLKLTCSVKNMLGVIPAKIKKQIYRKFKDKSELADALIDISLNIKNQITIVDGIYSMEGNGPKVGNTKRTGLVFAAYNQFELDYIIAKVLDFDVSKIPTVKNSIDRELFDLNNIKIIGENINTILVKDFKRS